MISRLAGRAAVACTAAAMLGGCANGAGSPDGSLSTSGAVVSNAVPAASSVRQKPTVHYYVVDLGTLGGSVSVANSINNAGWISGLSKRAGNTTVHGVLWINGIKTDLRTLGGPNSAIGWPVKNDRGELAGFSDLAQPDQLAENFCGFGSPNLCAGFQWKNGVLTPLSALGGNNSFAAGVNDAGQVVGFAESTVHDASCGAPQVLDYYGAIWSADGHARILAPEQGDAVSQAVAIDQAGAAVGASGTCGPPNNVRYGTAHAILWQPGNQPTDLGSLGGTTANIATAINDRGDVVGQSALSGNTTYHAVRWQRGSITDLGTLPGDLLSEALGLNNQRQAVGYSCDATGNCRGFIWQNGAMTDLNLLVHSQLDITDAGDINDKGWIVGQAFDSKTGRAPAVLLIPAQGTAMSGTSATAKVELPENVRKELLQSNGFRRFIP